MGSATQTKTAYFEATAAPRTWATLYAENSIATGCGSTSCHNGATAARFSMTSATLAYNNMVGTALPPVGVNSVTGCAPQKRVLPGDSAGSVLIRSIMSPHECTSFRMGSLGAQAVQDIADWIDHGVPR